MMRENSGSELLCDWSGGGVPELLTLITSTRTSISFLRYNFTYDLGNFTMIFIPDRIYT